MGRPKEEAGSTGLVSTAIRARPSVAHLLVPRAVLAPCAAGSYQALPPTTALWVPWLQSWPPNKDSFRHWREVPRPCGVPRAKPCRGSHPGPLRRSLVHSNLVTVPPSVMPPGQGICVSQASLWEKKKNKKGEKRRRGSYLG